jgi:hypothetical protein
MQAHTARTITYEVSRIFRLVMVGEGAAAEAVAAAKTKKSPDICFARKITSLWEKKEQTLPYLQKVYFLCIREISKSAYRHTVSAFNPPPYIRPLYGFLGRVVDLVLYKPKVLGSKPPLGGLSTNP